MKLARAPKTLRQKIVFCFWSDRFSNSSTRSFRKNWNPSFTLLGIILKMRNASAAESAISAKFSLKFLPLRLLNDEAPDLRRSATSPLMSLKMSFRSSLQTSEKIWWDRLLRTVFIDSAKFIPLFYRGLSESPNLRRKAPLTNCDDGVCNLI